MKLLLIWFLNALALLTVAYVLPGIHVDGFTAALVAALILGLINTADSAHAAGHGVHTWPLHTRDQRLAVLVCRVGIERI
jgi:hypothetical protein